VKLGATVDRVALDKIIVGIRRRRKVGSVRSLARSIDAHGLLHPILVRNGAELVAGQRRLEACRALGWTTIPVRHIEGLGDDELRRVELDENIERAAYLDFETSKARLAEMRQAEAEAKTPGTHPGVSRGKRGPTRKPGSREDVAERTGIDPKAQRNAERHVEVAERFPFMQRDGWRQAHVLEAGGHLDSKDLPRREHPKIATLLDRPGVPPEKAVAILANLRKKDADERQAIYTLATSDDPHDHKAALAKAIEQPPPPDPAALVLGQMQTLAQRAVKVCRDDRLRPALRAILDAITDALARFDDAHQKASA